MKTHTIPDKVKAKVDRMYDGDDKKRVIEALESGKIVYTGKVKLRGVKVDKDEGPMAPAPPAPASENSEPKKPGKEPGK